MIVFFLTRFTTTAIYFLWVRYALLNHGKDYSIRVAVEAMDVGKSTVDNWARQLKQERGGILENHSLMTPDQIKI
jgi:transposase